MLQFNSTSNWIVSLSQEMVHESHKEEEIKYLVEVDREKELGGEKR